MLPLFSPRVPFFESNQPGGAPPPAPPAPPAPPEPPAPPLPTTPPPAPPAEPTRDFEKEIKDLRSENASWRTKFQQANKSGQEALRQLAAQLGVEIPGGELDPKALQEEASKLRRENIELKVGSALSEAARKHGADSDLLIPVIRGSAALEKMDPSAESFTKDVSDLVKGMLEKNPKLRAAPVATRSGAEFPGGNPQVPQLTREQLKAMTPEQINEAREKGQLANLLAGRG